MLPQMESRPSLMSSSERSRRTLGIIPWQEVLNKGMKAMSFFGLKNKIMN